MSSTLSLSGRVELIKTVLLGTIHYWIQSYRFPVSVIKTLEKLFANFLWRNKMHAWAWDKMCTPKSEGGLSIRRIQDINNATGLKLVWRCCNSDDSICANWMRQYYFKDTNFWEPPIHLLDLGTWKFVAGNRGIAKPYIRRRIGNRETTSLWYDPWLKDGALIEHKNRTNSTMVSNPSEEVSKLIHQNSWHLTIPSLTVFWNQNFQTDIHAHEEDS